MNAQAQKFVNAIFNLKLRTKARKTEIYAYWSTGQSDRNKQKRIPCIFERFKPIKTCKHIKERLDLTKVGRFKHLNNIKLSDLANQRDLKQ